MPARDSRWGQNGRLAGELSRGWSRRPGVLRLALATTVGVGCGLVREGTPATEGPAYLRT